MESQASGERPEVKPVDDSGNGIILTVQAKSGSQFATYLWINGVLDRQDLRDFGPGRVDLTPRLPGSVGMFSVSLCGPATWFREQPKKFWNLEGGQRVLQIEPEVEGIA